MGHDPDKPLEPTSGKSLARVSKPRRARLLVIVVGVVVLAIAGGGSLVMHHWRERAVNANDDPGGNRPADPRLVYAGPFQNVHPEVAYVGDQKCAGCHWDLTRAFQQHPMGRSLLPVARIAATQNYDRAARNPFDALGTQFLVERQRERVLHKEIGRAENGDAVYEADVPVDYVLGSGTRGYAYLTNRDGYVFQSPVSWFSQKQLWDVSPGFSEAARSGRPVPGMCLACHANQVRPLDGYINRFEEPVFDGYAIGCERCHGPGAQHILYPGHKDPATGADYTIVNPRHLNPELRAAVCEQCHITGETRVLHRGRGLLDFRPGLALADFLSIYVPEADTTEPQKAVSHVEQMYLSACYLRSEEKPAEGKRKLGCTSCHDPHQVVAKEERVVFYRGRCLECHREQQCTARAPDDVHLKKTNNDSCIDCHMPRYPSGDIAHNASTDHRIHRPQPASPPSASTSSKREPRIVSFYRNRVDANDREAERDLGIALVHIMAQNLVQRKPLPARAGEQAIAALEAAVQNDPDDVAAWEARAEVLALVNRPAEALAVYEKVLARFPGRENSLSGAAMLAQNRQQRDQAIDYLRRAVDANPWHAQYRARLAELLADQKAWDKARPQAEAWLRLDPPNIDARFLWVRCLLQTGDVALARAEFAKIERLRPVNLGQLQARFAVESRDR